MKGGMSVQQLSPKRHFDSKLLFERFVPVTKSDQVDSDGPEGNFHGFMPLWKEQPSVASPIISEDTTADDVELKSKDNRRFSCPTCQQGFTRRYSLMLHQRTHTGAKPFCCQLCGMSFTRKDNLKLHQQTHTGKKPFTCPTSGCSKSFYQKPNLDRHMLLVHVKDKQFKCDVCGLGFGLRQTLKDHELTHMGQRDFGCRSCGRTFETAEFLRRHEGTHARDKPHQCKTCRRSFAQLKNLRAHQQVHAAHKPFTCQVCKRTFGRNTTLRAHQRTHTGEKPFNCQRCGDSFRHKISLKHHERTHEDDDGLMIETKEDLISDAVSCPTEVGPVGPEAVGFADEKYADSSREEEQADTKLNGITAGKLNELPNNELQTFDLDVADMDLLDEQHVADIDDILNSFLGS